MVLACVRRPTRPVGFRFCGMMLLVPVSAPSVSSSHGFACEYCAVMSATSIPMVNAVDARDADELDAGIHRRDLVRVERVLHVAVEAEQLCQTWAVDREARGPQRRTAERGRFTRVQASR